MASIKDALDECKNDTNAKLKYIIFAIPLFIAVYIYTKGDKTTLSFWTFLTIGVLECLGIMVKCTNNVMNYREKILPTLNPFSLFFNAIRVLIAISPIAVVTFYISNFLITKVFTMITVPQISQGATYLTYLVSVSIILTVFMLFAKKFSFKDAFDLKAISDSCIDVLIQTLWLGIQLAIVNGIFVGLITYLFWLFIGIENVIVYYVWCIATVYNVAVIGNYLGQLNYEALHQADKKRS